MTLASTDPIAMVTAQSKALPFEKICSPTSQAYRMCNP
ncbi:hypothetical protein SRM_00479 [Salinibacter ruber M8]|uniref:Uncharacterized protein n=1 Tax=Salinibacter ruber (strain M8) TaxID=761659 RepID=D5H5U5_SALRM|nr:hypothetical protein SRM_00479 [Salinibacter ruber M8]